MENNDPINDKITNYIKSGGRLFTIISIDTIRDGGTRKINCTNHDSFYIHRSDKTLHTQYPPTKENLITDKLHIDFIIEKIKTHINKLFAEYHINENLYQELFMQNNTNATVQKNIDS